MSDFPFFYNECCRECGEPVMDPFWDELCANCMNPDCFDPEWPGDCE